MAFSVFQKQPADTSNIIQMLALQHYIRSSISILLIMYLNINLNMEFKNKTQQNTMQNKNWTPAYVSIYKFIKFIHAWLLQKNPMLVL